MLSNFLSNGRSRFQNADRRPSDNRKRRQMRSRRLLALENLEERVVLSTLYVNGAWAGLADNTPVEIGDGGEMATIGVDAFGAIQAAINKAAVVDTDLNPDQEPDTIRVAPGTYVETLRINKSLRLAGDGSGVVTIDVSGASAIYGVSVTSAASNVSLSGFSLVGSTDNTALRYGINVDGASGLSINDVIVESTSRTGINLHGATDFSIDTVRVSDTTGAGLFFTDVKDGTLSNITTEGNDWTGVAFSTYGRYFDIGISGVIISGNNSFGESATPNGGVMFEESRWDKDANTYDKENAHPITFSANPADGADVTFDFGDSAPWLGYVLTGEQSDTDGWKVRHNFYGTLAQGLHAAIDAHPGHYTGEDITLSPLAPTTGAPVLDGPDQINRGSTYTLTLTAAADAGTETEWVINWGDETSSTVPSADPSATHVYTGAPGDYTITVTEIVAGVYTSGASELKVSVLNVNPTIEITGAPDESVARNTEIEFGSSADGLDVDDLTYAWTVTRDGVPLPDIGDEATFTFTPTLPGEYVVTLTATGLYDASATETAEFTVFNVPPMVAITNAPTDSVARNEAITLTAAGDDGDDDDLTYSWTVIFNGETIKTGDRASFSFTPTLPGAYQVSVIANDGYDDSAAAHATIIAANANPNVAITGAPDSLIQGESVTLGSSASDPDGDPLGYAWSITRGDTVILTGAGDSLHFAPAVPGAYLVTLTVTDPHGGSATATRAITVVGVAPTVTITGAPGSVNQGESIHLGSEVVNPAGGALAHAWTVTRDGVVVHTGDGEALDFTPLAPGNYVVTLTVTDIDGDAGTASHAFGVANVAPDVVIAPLPDAPVMSGDVVTLAATATDPNPNAALSYTWTITRNGVFMGQAHQAALQFIPLFSGLYEATLVVSDGEGGVTTRSVQFEVQTNLPPAAEQAVEVLQQRVDIQVARQQMRIDALNQRYDQNPPPFVQRTLNRMVQTQIRMQNMVARRMVMLQRLFSRRGFR